jgi:hypothetical protein
MSNRSGIKRSNDFRNANYKQKDNRKNSRVHCCPNCPAEFGTYDKYREHWQTEHSKQPSGR